MALQSLQVGSTEARQSALFLDKTPYLQFHGAVFAVRNASAARYLRDAAAIPRTCTLTLLSVSACCLHTRYALMGFAAELLKLFAVACQVVFGAGRHGAEAAGSAGEPVKSTTP